MAVINTILGILKSIITIIKKITVYFLDFLGIIVFCGLFAIVIVATFLYYAAECALIKIKRKIVG